MYEGDPDKVHSKYTIHADDDNIVAINRLSEKTDKIPVLSRYQITLKRMFRRIKKARGQAVGGRKKGEKKKKNVAEQQECSSEVNIGLC